MNNDPANQLDTETMDALADAHEEMAEDIQSLIETRVQEIGDEIMTDAQNLSTLETYHAMLDRVRSERGASLTRTEKDELDDIVSKHLAALRDELVSAIIELVEDDGN